MREYPEPQGAPKMKPGGNTTNDFSAKMRKMVEMTMRVHEDPEEDLDDEEPFTPDELQTEIDEVDAELQIIAQPNILAAMDARDYRQLLAEVVVHKFYEETYKACVALALARLYGCKPSLYNFHLNQLKEIGASAEMMDSIHGKLGKVLHLIVRFHATPSDDAETEV